jgi:hypothetical protein
MTKPRTKKATTTPTAPAPPAVEPLKRPKLLPYYVFAVLPCLALSVVALTTKDALAAMLALLFLPVAAVTVGLSIYFALNPTEK